MSQRPILSGLRAAAALTVLGMISLAGPAQVKLEYKYPEGQKLTYKTTANTSQSLKLAGQAIETERRRHGHHLAERSARSGPTQPSPSPRRWNRSPPRCRFLAASTSRTTPRTRTPRSTILSWRSCGTCTRWSARPGLHGGAGRPKTRSRPSKEPKRSSRRPTSSTSRPRRRSAAAWTSSTSRRSSSSPTAICPDVLARPGEPWERTENLAVGGGQTLTFHKKYEYAGTEKLGDATLDKINVKTTEVKYAMDANSPSPLKVLKSDLKVESGDGVILFDREAGARGLLEGQNPDQRPHDLRGGRPGDSGGTGPHAGRRNRAPARGEVNGGSRRKECRGSQLPPVGRRTG